MVLFMVLFCFALLCALCIATLIRGWKAYCVLVVLLPTFTILLPMAPSKTALLIWYVVMVVPLAIMVWYGERGRVAFENFFSQDLGPRLERGMKKFKEWNQ